MNSTNWYDGLHSISQCKWLIFCQIPNAYEYKLAGNWAVYTLQLGQHETSTTQKRFFEHLQFWFRTTYLLWFAFYVFLAAISAVCCQINIFQK
jgi:hypothetical protein